MNVNRFHIAVVSALLALAALLGTLAATRTVGLGTASHRAADTAYAARVHQLNAFEAKLKAELAASARPSAKTPATRVVYHRPPPVVIVKHTHHGDDGSFETEGGGGDD